MSGAIGPIKLEVSKGDVKAFCACGLSSKGIYCDGTHSKQNSGKTPNVVKFEENKTVYMCACGKTGKAPFCDGTHKK